jgi:AbrB family looped-hinge helix DNA binding protein
MTTVLSQKGQIVLPSAVRQQMHLEPGQDFEVIIDDEDTILLRRVSRPPNHGLIELLQACPYSFELPPRANDRPRSIEL